MSTPEQIQARIRQLVESARQTQAYKAQGASLEFTEDMARLMKDQNITQSVLAARINVSPAYITKILRGGTNFTLDTMVKIADALDAEFRCHLQPAGHRTQWFDIVDGSDHVDEFKYNSDDFKPVPVEEMLQATVNQ